MLCPFDIRMMSMHDPYNIHTTSVSDSWRNGFYHFQMHSFRTSLRHPYDIHRMSIQCPYNVQMASIHNTCPPDVHAMSIWHPYNVHAWSIQHQYLTAGENGVFSFATWHAHDTPPIDILDILMIHSPLTDLTCSWYTPNWCTRDAYNILPLDTPHMLKTHP